MALLASLASTLPDIAVAQSRERFREELLVKLLTAHERALVCRHEPMKRWIEMWNSGEGNPANDRHIDRTKMLSRGQSLVNRHN